MITPCPSEMIITTMTRGRHGDHIDHSDHIEHDDHVDQSDHVDPIQEPSQPLPLFQSHPANNKCQDHSLHQPRCEQL